MESILEMPASVGRLVRVPSHEELPPGPLATTRLDVQLLQLGLATPEELGAAEEEEEDPPDRYRRFYDEERPRVLTLADKLHRLFEHDFPGVPTSARFRSGPPVSCWNLAATSTSTLSENDCRSRKESSFGTFCD